MLLKFILIAAVHHPLLCQWDGHDAFWCVRPYSATTWAVSHTGNSQPSWSAPPGELVEAPDDNIDAAVEITDFEIAVEIATLLNSKRR